MKSEIGDRGIALSCVVDDTPEIRSSIVPWLATATELAGIDPSRIHIHHVCSLSAEIQSLCRELEVNTHRVDAFDRNHPHTNKIQQCATDFSSVRQVALTDVDVAFAGLPPFDSIRTAVAGKTVDRPNPPMEVLRDVFSAAGVAPIGSCRNTYLDEGNVLAEFETMLGNYNGGLYVIEREQLSRIGRTWTHWARWLIANIKLLGRWGVNADQVAFCLAISDLQMTVDVLDDAWNFPTHLHVGPGDTEPHVFHHHARLDEGLRLVPVSAPRAHRGLARVNDAIERFRRRHFG